MNGTVFCQLTILRHQNTKTAAYKLAKNDWVRPFFAIFRFIREILFVTVAFDRPVSEEQREDTIPQPCRGTFIAEELNFQDWCVFMCLLRFATVEQSLLQTLQNILPSCTGLWSARLVLLENSFPQISQGKLYCGLRRSPCQGCIKVI